MQWIHKKLNSRSGISMAIALVFFLLCAMVGTVVLSAASVSAGNTARERQLYRETLALTSAAKLLSQDIQGMTFTGRYTRTETVTTTVFPAESHRNTMVESGETYAEGSFELRGSKIFKAKGNPAVPGTPDTDDLNLAALYFANQRVLQKTAEPKETVLTFGGVEEQNIPEVTGRLTVGTDYAITAVLQCGGNFMTVLFPAGTDLETDVAPPSTVENESVTKRTTVTTYTTTLTWGQPTTRKGDTTYAETP